MNDSQKKILKIVMISAIVLTISLNILLMSKRDNTIYIGTKNLTEQQIVANIYKQVIENKTDYQVKIVSGLDTTSFVNNALKNGDIDMYVEYTSTAFLELFDHQYDNQSKDEIYNQLDKDYQQNDLHLNSRLGFENSNAIICSDFCQDIDSVSELDSKKFTFAAPVYFFERSDGYNLLAEKYDFSKVKRIKADPVVIYTGIMSGQIDVGLGFTTDAKLAREQIKVLEDSDGVFPTYDAILVTRNDLEQRFKGISSVLKTVENKISTKEMQKMNNDVENKQLEVTEVVTSFLKNGGLNE